MSFSLIHIPTSRSGMLWCYFSWSLILPLDSGWLIDFFGQFCRNGWVTNLILGKGRWFHLISGRWFHLISFLFFWFHVNLISVNCNACLFLNMTQSLLFSDHMQWWLNQWTDGFMVQSTTWFQMLHIWAPFIFSCCLFVLPYSTPSNDPCFKDHHDQMMIIFFWDS